MIPIEELEKVLQGCISRKLKRVGRKEFIDLFDYLDKANELNATQAERIAELEAHLDAEKTDHTKTACMLGPELAMTQTILQEKLELIKRHEDALEWLAETPNFDSLLRNCKTDMYALCRIGDKEGISTAMTTPLAAIEAAMKEEK